MAYWLGVLCWALVISNVIFAGACHQWRKKYDRLYYDWQQEHKRNVIADADVQHISSGAGREPMPGV